MAKQQIPGSIEALESIIIYLAEAVSKDYGITMEAAKPKALELLSNSSVKLLGAAPSRPAKGTSKAELSMNIKACRNVINMLKVESNGNQSVLKLIDKIEFHLKKIEGSG